MPIEYMKEILLALLSWPTAAIVSLIVFRKPISAVVTRFVRSDDGTAKLGPIEVRLGRIADNSEDVLNRVNALTVVMAESRLTELRVTLDNFGPAISKLQRREMELQLEKLASLVPKVDDSENR